MSGERIQGETHSSLLWDLLELEREAGLNCAHTECGGKGEQL